jgi:hypothetical protein
MGALDIEIICWIFFLFTTSITLKAHKNDWIIIKNISGAISILLALAGLIDLLIILAPYL